MKIGAKLAMGRMRLAWLLVTCAVAFSTTLVHCQAGGRVSFHDENSEDRENPHASENMEERGSFNKSRQGKDLFDWIGLGTGRNVDPYLAKVNLACRNGDLAECFKSRALNTFSEFFDQAAYDLNDNVRVIRMSRDVVREVNRQPYEYTTESRADESEWDQMMKFASRKAEKFVKTVALELYVPTSETGENEVYAPRFLDEIADEIDTLEDKKDTLFSRHQFRKLLIPMLIVLKLFKLKLLLFLPLILGLASFKKFLGFLAIVIPGLIGFFKLYKPHIQSYHPPVYSQSGIGYLHYKENNPYAEHDAHHDSSYHGDSVSFGQDLAYRGYQDYQS